MTILSRHVLIPCALLCLLTACASLNARKTAQIKIAQAQQEIPEDQLLDVGITVFESDEITNKRAKQEGTNLDVRKAENHFIPYHLKNTLEQSGYWGMVRVTPLESESADVLVTGEIIESNGENLTVRVVATDSRGTVWLKKKYKATVTDKDYKNTIPGQHDPFQGLYNTIANDMAHHMKKLSSDEIKTVRTISKLQFAKDFAPQPFEDYLQEGKNGKLSLNRLPADNDTMMDRLLKIREREYMFEDTINEYYEGFYNEMWPPYTDWRMSNLTERIALAQQKRSALLREVGGALLVALAVFMEVQDVHSSPALTGALILGGGQVFLSGINISKQSQMHYEALKELGESFGSEMQPVVMEFEGRQYELTGSAEEQFNQWRALLRTIYFTETGFKPDTGGETLESDGSE